jgi:predicted XRE-type DNA-binding protein
MDSAGSRAEKFTEISRKWDNWAKRFVCLLTGWNVSKNIARVTQGSGNVFADLGLPRADERQTQVRLAVAINQAIKDRRLSQAGAAHLLEINQPKISALANYRLDGFSVERLMRFLNVLGRNVEIIVRRNAKSRKMGRILVSAA